MFTILESKNIIINILLFYLLDEEVFKSTLSNDNGFKTKALLILWSRTFIVLI